MRSCSLQNGSAAGPKARRRSAGQRPSPYRTIRSPGRWTTIDGSTGSAASGDPEQIEDQAVNAPRPEPADQGCSDIEPIARALIERSAAAGDRMALEDLHPRTARRQQGRRGQPGDSGPDHHDVGRRKDLDKLPTPNG